MNGNTESSGQGLGIAALVTGIIALIMSVIPCIGILAIVPGVISVLLAIAGLRQSMGRDRGTIIAGLIIGIMATIISLSQYALLNGVVRHKNVWKRDIREVVEQIREEVIKQADITMQKGNFSIIIQTDDDTIKISSDVNIRRLEKKLEDLEGVDTAATGNTTIRKQD